MKDILITGASGTIGTALVRGLPNDQFRFYVTSRQPKRLAAFHNAQNILGMAALDLARSSSITRIVQRFFERAKHPYGLICAAGTMGAMGNYASLSWTRWQKTLAENFTGHALMIHEFLRRFPKTTSAGGRILTFSGAGLGGSGRFDHVSAYSTAKAALTHLTEALAPELKKQRITINTIAPGAVLSQMTRQTLAAGSNAGSLIKDAQACLRSGGTSPDLTVKLVTYLLSPRASALTGRLFSARFDQDILQSQTSAVAQDPHRFRLRRIDEELFGESNDERALHDHRGQRFYRQSYGGRSFETRASRPGR